MTRVRVGAIEFDLTCDQGRKVGHLLDQTRGDLAHRVYTYQANEDREGTPGMVKLRDEIKILRLRLTERGIGVTRHVGHCSDCSRLTGFTGHLDYDRAPHRAKPDLPAMADIAGRLARGEALEAIAVEFDRSPSTLQQRLGHAGYSPVDGRPLHSTKAARPRTPPPPPWWEPWRDEALCAQTDPEAFFPEKGSSTREAKAVCARCPVAAECLDHALAGDDPWTRFGIWGGLSERERRALKKQLEPSAES